MSWWDRLVWDRTRNREALTLEQLLAEEGQAQRTAAGEPVTVDTALRLSTVWGCVRLLADSVSTLPLHVYRGDDRDPIPSPPLLQRPSADFPELADWLWAVMASLLLRGNAWGVITDRSGAGMLPAQVDLVHPDRVSITTNGDGRRVIRVAGEEVPRSALWHVKAFPWPGQLEGLSPIAYAREAIGLGLGAEKYGAKLFGDAAIPSGVLTSDQRIGQPEADNLKARWAQAHKGKREIAVLGGGAKFQPVTIAPDEAQFIQTQKFSVATICRFYGVPPEMMAGETAGHEAYTSPEMRGVDFLTFSLRPWLYRIERAVSTLLPSTQRAKFNAGGVRQGDAARPLRGAPHRHRGRVPDPQRGPRAGRPPADSRHRRPAATRPARGYRMILTREVATGLQVRDDGDGRILFGPLLPWNVEARVLDRGRIVVETFQRGALADADPARLQLTALHPRDNQQLPIGRTLTIDERADAAWGEWRVSRTAAGDEVLELARDGVPLGLSIGFREVAGGSRWSPDRRRVVRTRAQLDHIAVVRTPAYVGAGVVGVRDAGSWPPETSRCCPWPGCAMGKAKRKYSAPRSPALCLGCQKPIKFGDRCPLCTSELRRRTTRKRR